jgi:hypothetical protein
VSEQFFHDGEDEERGRREVLLGIPGAMFPRSLFESLEAEDVILQAIDADFPFRRR